MENILGSIKHGNWDAVCILGPTASGKTKFAVELARTLTAQWKPCEIISADSRQVYRGMDIGTGKDLSEYGEVPAHLLDIVDAGTKYNIFEYQKDFSKAYTNILERGCFPIICGGSGLYIEAATRGYELYEVLPDEELRARLEPKPMEELVQMLKDLKAAKEKVKDYDLVIFGFNKTLQQVYRNFGLVEEQGHQLADQPAQAKA